MKKIITCLIIILTLICTIDMSYAKKSPKTEADSGETTTENIKPVKEKKKKATKEETKAAKEQASAAQRNTTIEKTRKRTALGMYLNPNLDVQEIRASHILVKKRKDAVQIRKDIIEGKITFEDAAKEYSLCPTGIKGGDLGYFNRKRMDQNFADRAFDLKIGEISEPVGTKFGWHLIKLYDKR